ncbi:KLHDC4 isoform 2 [Pan troglodytes]|uniref:KLHDC4 isoform 2 n=1 Tax=Pan troglodytes TaxID=9598 RepID=A0A2J8LF34_PANTR|nr:KLHDC4 isoform 2 [Pan troglodytes]
MAAVNEQWWCSWRPLSHGAQTGGKDGGRVYMLGRTGGRHRPEQVAWAHEKGVSDTGCLSQMPGVDEADEWQ